MKGYTAAALRDLTEDVVIAYEMHPDEIDVAVSLPKGSTRRAISSIAPHMHIATYRLILHRLADMHVSHEKYYKVTNA